MDIEYNNKTFTRLKTSIDATRGWRKKAMEANKFYCGDQWSAADVAYLQSQGRPAITFNKIAPLVDAVIGFQLNNKQTVKFRPRGMEDGMPAELMSKITEWIRDNCQADEEESLAFQDCLITGLGFTETSISYEDDLDGEITVKRINPFEVIWDTDANDTKNLANAKWIAKYSEFDKEQIESEFGKDVLSKLTMDFKQTMLGLDVSGDIHDFDADRDYNMFENEYPTGPYSANDKYTVFQYQYYEHTNVYRVGDPLSGKLISLSEEQYNRVKDRLEVQGSRVLKQRKKVYYQKYVCGTYEWNKQEIPCFTIKAITGKYDPNHKVFFGMIRNLFDPQQWSNKFLSLTLHLINKTAKGGLLMEEGAVANVDEFIDSWSSADEISVVNVGGLNKIQPKQSIPIPQSIERMMAYANDSIAAASGINPEFIGMADAQVSGILEQERKRAALGCIAWIFDAMKRYRKTQGKLMAALINQFLPNPTILRIIGEQYAEFIPKLRDTDLMKYDLIVDNSPTSPNTKMEVWGLLKEILPTMLNAGIPIPPTIVQYLPMPETFTQQWSQLLQQQQQASQQPNPADVAVAQNLQAQSAERMAKAQSYQVDAQLKQQQLENAEFANQIKAFTAAVEAEVKMGRLDVEKAQKLTQVMRDVQQSMGAPQGAVSNVRIMTG